MGDTNAVSIAQAVHQQLLCNAGCLTPAEAHLHVKCPLAYASRISGTSSSSVNAPGDAAHHWIWNGSYANFSGWQAASGFDATGSVDMHVPTDLPAECLELLRGVCR